MEAVISKNNVATLVENFESKLVFNADKQNAAKTKLDTAVFPTTRDERWKYTRVSKIVKQQYANVSTLSSFDVSSVESLDCKYRIVLVNGVLDEANTSLPSQEGVVALPMSMALESHSDVIASHYAKHMTGTEVLENINTALAQDGLFLHVAKNVQLKDSIQIITVNTDSNSWSNPRNLLIGETGSQFHVVNVLPETGADESVINEATEIYVGENSNISYDKLQFQNGTSFYFGTEQVYQEKNSTFSINTITTNGKLVRNDLNIVVNGENCETNLAGVYAGKDKQHIDNHTTVDHKLGHCESNEIYKGVMDGQSTGVFNGKVYVRPNAQKINAYQSNGNVLLSKDASIRSKPELEIYADDVRCSHGSTTGQLDEEGVFYLRSRGLSEKNARKLMVSAFIAEALEEIKNEDVRTFVDQLLDNRFQL